MASNDSVLQDDDGEYSDWIEIHNPDAAPVSLAGWHLTDNANNKTKWTFPAVTVPAGGYLVVFATSENRRDPAAALHTNFGLSAGGEYLGLVQPDGTTVASEFSPEFPAQFEDVSYGVTQPTQPGEAAQVGFFAAPTPGARNGGADTLMILETVTFSPTSGPFTGTVEVALTGAAAGQVIRYHVAAPSEDGAAVPAPTAESPAYVEPLILSTAAVVRAAVFSADGTRHGPYRTQHYVPVDQTSPQRVDAFRSRLPVAVFDNHGFGPMIKDDIDRRAWLYLYEPAADGLTQFADGPGFTSALDIKVRGQTSSLFPKKSYNFDLLDGDGEKIARTLPGLGRFEEWSIIGPWNYDRSYFRNAFVYGLSNGMGRWAPETRLTEVFFNADGGPLDMADYAGIYMFTDRANVEPGRIDITELDTDDVEDDEITGGYLIEIDEPDPEKLGWTTDNGIPGIFTSVLSVDDPKLDDLAPEQITYIRDYVQAMEDALVEGRANQWINRSYLQYLDRGSWIDHHLLNTFVKNVDAFWRSSKFHKDRGGRIVAGPVWDFDRSIDSADPRDNEWGAWNAPDNTVMGFGVHFWSIGWWGMLAQDPEFMQGWVDRWQELRGSLLSNGALVGRMARLRDEIGLEAAARDALRWPDNVSERGSFAQEVAHMQDWLVSRAVWIDHWLVAPPTETHNPDGSVTVKAPNGAQLVYTLGGADPRLRGGAVAPDALLSEEAVTFAAGTVYRARSYNRFIGAWPGSKWSRPVPGPLGEPYAEGPRLSNLSSRARVGGGDDVLIAGLVINDTDDKRVLLRGVGPALAAFELPDVLASPRLTVFDADGAVVDTNTGWDDGSDAEVLADAMEAVGAFPLPAGSNDTALLLRLPAGRYTVHLGGIDGAAGTALLEAYEMKTVGALLNLSVRGVVASAANPLIAGFVITGDHPKRVLVRAVGPGLAVHGVANPLSDPKLEVVRAGTVVASNQDWADTDAELLATAAGLVGAFALEPGAKDAAVLVTLPPGVYTAVASGEAGVTGPALVEVYELK